MVPRNVFAALLARSRFLGLCLAAALACANGPSAAVDKVGDVSLTIGVSRLVGAQGSQPVSKGMAVQVGDRIETERGGHVHLRFVDGAYVSVRPSSRLVIESYKYDPAHPEQGEVRFRLDSGVGRAISGKVAQTARERFRLNTPIAAIGVRGTDFVVLAQPDGVWATVHSGAIVLAPLGEGCSSSGLGPCSTAAARTLSADMGRVMLAFQPQLSAPRVVPIDSGPTPDRISPPTQYEPRTSTAGSPVSTPRDQTNEVLAVQAVTDQPPRLAVESLTPVPGPEIQPPPAPPPLPAATMVWGRWAAAAWPGDSQTVTYFEGRPGRDATVANGYYVLFRPDSQLKSLVSNLGRVDFQLRDAQANLLRNGVPEIATVTGGWLSVDFSSRAFGTGVSMSHPQAGATSIEAAGKVRDDGIFAVRTPGGSVAGALTLDGKEAGYFFEKTVPLGTFIGVTRWGR